MSTNKRADLHKVGEEFAPLEFCVTQEWNTQFQEALEAYYPRYETKGEGNNGYVVPGLLIANSNITRSPSFRLDPGMAAVHTKEEVEFFHPANVGVKLKVTWKVTDYYEKRGRPFQIVESWIIDENGTKILKRIITDTFMGGPYKGAKE